MPKRLNPQQQKRTPLARAFTRFTRHAIDIFEPSDDVLLLQEEPRLGIWIGVTSNRHAELFERLAKDHFKGYEKHEYSAGGRAWVRFGDDYDGKVPREVMEAAERSKKATA